METISYRLPVFEGPLDLLLYLVQKNKLNIYDIPIAEVLQQYMETVSYTHLDVYKRQKQAGAVKDGARLFAKAAIASYRFCETMDPPQRESGRRGVSASCAPVFFSHR